MTHLTTHGSAMLVAIAIAGPLACSSSNAASDGGTGGSGCSALSACCRTLTASETPSECLTVVEEGTAEACAGSLAGYQKAGMCLGDGGASDGGGKTGAVTTVAEFCAAKARAECPAAVTDLCMVSASACIAARTQLCNTDAMAAVAAGDRAFDAANVDACITATTAVYAMLEPMTDTTLPYASLDGSASCSNVFPGTVEANAACTVSGSSLECAGVGDICTPMNAGSTMLICAPETQVADGQSCGEPGATCPAGDDCTKNANDEYLCLAGPGLGERGAPCTSDADCDPATAGFCDTYNGTGCQPDVSFTSKDCQGYGQAP